MCLVDKFPGDSSAPSQSRILDWDIRTDSIWVIRTLGLQSGNRANQMATYCAAPVRLPLQEFLAEFTTGKWYEVRCEDITSRPDSVSLALCPNAKAKEALQKSFSFREKRWNAICPLVTDPITQERVPLKELLSDKSLSKRIAERAKTLKQPASTLYRWLHVWLAGGGRKNALLSRYSRCGNPGVEKPQKQKLGRKPAVVVHGLREEGGYVLTEKCKELLGLGYSQVSPTVTLRGAWLNVSMAFWADHVDDGKGGYRAELFASEKRPTFAQFKYWGPRQSGESIKSLFLSKPKYLQATEARGGSEKDEVTAVCQLSQVDSTSTDVYLTRVGDRLTILPPPSRTVLREVRLGLIYGWYVGWEPPSGKIALLALRHGAMPSKVEYAKRFGVDIDPDAIPGFIAKKHRSDHGELKNERLTEFADQLGFGLDFPPPYRGDKKGSVESSHKSSHDHVDHKLPGTTHGRTRVRGDEKPIKNGLLHFHEYMNIWIRDVVRHNTVEEVPDLAPDEFLLQVPKIKPTRINIYKWMTANHMNVSIPYRFEEVEQYTLTDHDAVIRKNGVFLLVEHEGYKKTLERLRYTSPELARTGLLSEVKQTGKSIRVRVKVDPENPSTCYLPTKQGMLQLVHDEEDVMLRRMTTYEWFEFTAEAKLQNQLNAQERDQIDADELQHKDSITHQAMKEQKAARLAEKKKPEGKTSSRLKVNAKKESASVQPQRLSQNLPPLPLTGVKERLATAETMSGNAMAEDVMSAFNCARLKQ